jgi:ABC-2 type transport system permease protein
MKFLREFLAEIMVFAGREWRLIRQDSKMRSLLLLAPLLNAMIVCGVYAPAYVTEVPIAVVQQDFSALSHRMIRWLDQHQKLKVIQTLPDTKSAEELFDQGKIAGYVVLEKNLSLRLKRNEETRVLLFCEAGNMVLANTLSVAVQGVVQTMSAGLSMHKARRLGAFKDQAQALAAPIRADIRPIGNPSLSYADFMLPGMLLAVLQQVILLGLALSWAGEKALPQKSLSLLLGKNLPHFILHFLWLLLFCGLVLPLSSVSSEVQIGSLLIFALLFVIVMIAWGTWVSLVVGDRLGATQALMFLSVPSFILSGYTWPTASLPEALQWFSQILPLTHAAVMFRKIYGAGFEISAFPRELGLLLLLLGLHLLATYVAVRRLQRQSQMPASVAPNS